MRKKKKPIVIPQKQQDCISFKPEGTLLVQGVAGSGKTTVVLERARQLDERETRRDGPKVLVLTYNRALTSWIKELSGKSAGKSVEANTFHSWACDLLSPLGLTRNGTVRDRPEIIRHAKNYIKRMHPNASWPNIHGYGDYELVRFLGEEITWMKNWGLVTTESYMNSPRTGRGKKLKLSPSQKETILKVYFKYESLLETRYRCIDFDDAALRLEKHIHKIPMNKRPSHILIDEAQDFSPAQFRAVAKTAVKSLTIAADKGQQIYRRGFTWKSVGISVHSGNSKYLLNSFRSTGEIVRLATSLLANDPFLKNDPEYLSPDTSPDSEIIPELHLCRSDSVETEKIIELIRMLRLNFPEDSIGVIACKNEILDRYAQVFNQHLIPWLMVKESETGITGPGVKLVTFNSAKGLEFDHVIVTGLNKNSVPYPRAEAGDDEEAHISSERKKLYVAMTRARLTLHMAAVEPVSQFVHELDPNLYKVIR
ncbi:UvrD-helicase domain-containing protein [Heliobacterium undosum]|uniref:DNA 3'-5' helicase n=1 Tax=Heliomicrobium undosum TaxID=121734 RepID=A0A845L406_9FIRM|nr:3'-5' exonuclease [Heliomicrobium undosum]MZP31372.1 UvrD-helicase domain-containing protein [Heliomicrobium undosum]